MNCTCQIPKGTKIAHCSQCHETFTSVSAFDAHQNLVDGAVVCKDPCTATRKDQTRVFKANPKGWALDDPNPPDFRTLKSSRGSCEPVL